MYNLSLVLVVLVFSSGGDDTPAIPQNRAGIPVIPNEFLQTINGNRFLLHDSCDGDPNRLLIFATNEGLSLLESSDHWFADGTCSVSPNTFFQVYTVHAVFHGRVLPCAFALLPNKTQATYDRLFGELATHLNGHVPTDILFDYEKTAMNSAENVFAGITVTGCFFHLSQNIWRRIRENGLRPLYRNDPDFAKFMRI